MAFDVSTATAVEEAPVGFDATSARPQEEARQPVLANSRPSKAPVATSGASGPDFSTWYAGLDGIDDRVSPAQKAAFSQLDRVSDNPKEARARMVNQVYVQNTLKGQPVGANWPTVKATFAKQIFGVDDPNITDTKLYGLIGKQFDETKVARTEAFANATPSERFGMIIEAFPKQFEATTKETVDQASKPFVPLPDLSPDFSEHHAVASGVYKGIKPFIEGVESRAGVGAIPVTEALSLARAYPAAKAALTGITGLFSGLMAKGTVDAVKARNDIMSDPKATTEQKVQANTAIVASGVATLLGAFGTIESVSPDILPKLKGQSVPEAVESLATAAEEAKTPEEKQALVNGAEALHQVAPEQAMVLPPAEPPVPTLPAEPTKTEVATYHATQSGMGVMPDFDLYNLNKDLPGHPAGSTVSEKTLRDAGLEVADRKVLDKSAAPESSVSEPVKIPESFGMTNEAVDNELRSAGLEPSTHGEKLEFEQARQDAAQKLAADPLAGHKLIEQLEAKPRPVTGQEDLLIVHELTRLSMDRNAAEGKLIKAVASGDKDAIPGIETKIALARDAYKRAADVDTLVGTANAQGLALRRARLREDYSLASMERQLAAASKDGKLTKDQEGLVRDIDKRLKQTAEDLTKYNERRLKAKKTRLANATAEMKAKLESGDLSKKPKPQPIELDEEGIHLAAEHRRVRDEFDAAVIKARLDQRTNFEWMQDKLIQWRRGFLLSGPVTAGKLAAAATTRMATLAGEEAVGGALSKVPGISKVAEKAPREGGLNLQAEAKALTAAVTTGMRDAYDVLRTGRGNLDVLYGNEKGQVRASDILPREMIDFMGSIHAALKAPVKRAEFTRSFEKRASFAMEHGVDTSNPLIQSRLMMEAYKDANRAIFMEDSAVVDAYKRALSRFSQVDPTTGKVALGDQIKGTALRAAFPIVKVPVNLVAQTFQYATGSVTGSARLGRAFYRGIDKLSPDEADLIMRELKKGSVGAGALLLGYFNPKEVGGYYQPGEKRKPTDAQVGGFRIYGENIPTWLLHNPLLEAVQIGATIRRVADAKLHKKDHGPQGTGSGLMAAGLGLTEEIPFAREAVEMAKIMDPNQRGYALGQLAKGVVVPAAVSFAAEKTDTDSKGKPIPRKASGIVQGIESGIPGLRENLPKRNINTSLRSQ